MVDIFTAVSVNGGASWGANTRLTTVQSDESTANAARDSGNNYGEYLGLAAFGGTAFAGWTDARAANFTNGTNEDVYFGRVSRAGAQVSVFGDEDFIAQDDLIEIILDPSGTLALIFVNDPAMSGPPAFNEALAAINQINIFGLGGNDTLTIDSSNGLITVPNGIRFDGGNGFNSLTLTGTSAQTEDTYSVGPNPGEGKSVITGPGPAVQTVFFQHLAPVLDTVVAGSLIVNATPANNTINYTASPAGRGLVTLDNFEPIEFSNKTALTINAGVGNDTINLNNTGSPTALTSITVNAGDGEDKVTTLAGLPTALTLDGGDGNDLLDASGATGPATLVGGTANDTLIGGSAGDTINGGSGEDLIDARGGSNTLDGGPDDDTILVSGTAGPDLIETTHGAGTFGITGGLSAGTNTISGIEAVRVEAGNGADQITLNLSAAGGLKYTVLGGNPIGAPGDVLQVNSSETMTVTPGPENDSGSVDAATTVPTNVSYDEIELLIIGGPGGGGIVGTNGPDAITIIARDSSYIAGADGVQDFTVSVNTGPEILFLNKPTLTVDALAGSDQVTLRTPAPNQAAWNVNVTVNGGPPAADTDRLIVETPGPVNAVYTPGTFDGGTLDLTSLAGTVAHVTIASTEVLTYDGQGDSDNLTVNGTAADDTIVHTSGVNDRSGSFQVNSLLALSYQNLGVERA